MSFQDAAFKQFWGFDCEDEARGKELKLEQETIWVGLNNG